MANWKTYRISDVVNEIEEGKYVLPVIQRSLVWTEEKMELLFDTVLKGDSFSGVIAIKEEKGKDDEYKVMEDDVFKQINEDESISKLNKILVSMAFLSGLRISEIASLNIEDIDFDKNEIKIDVSVGISVFPDHSSDLDSLINQADRAMYEAKKIVGCSYAFYQKGAKDESTN